MMSKEKIDNYKYGIVCIVHDCKRFHVSVGDLILFFYCVMILLSTGFEFDCNFLSRIIQGFQPSPAHHHQQQKIPYQSKLPPANKRLLAVVVPNRIPNTVETYAS